MSAVIYYFSGTGNSLQAAKEICAGLAGARTEPIAKHGKDAAVEPREDAIGIVFPVYMWGPPLIVCDFARKLKARGKYIFAAATCGGMAGGALSFLDGVLRENGMSLSFGFTLKYPGNYTPLGGAISAEKQEKLFAKASEKIQKKLEVIARQKIAKIESGFPFAFLTKLLYKTASPKIPEMDKGFRATDKCNFCGICAQICPVGNIKYADNKPVWTQKCQMCFRCLQWCPQGAIELGNKTEGKKRYRHPSCSLNDFMDSPSHFGK